MKTILLGISLLLAGGEVLGQTAWKMPLPIDSVSQRVTYAAVVPVPGASQDELYSRAREWFAVTFKSANAVLQMDDQAAGKLIGKGTTAFTYRVMRMDVSPVIGFMVTVAVKDGRYRYEFADLKNVWEGGTIGGRYVSRSEYPLEDGIKKAVPNKKGQHPQSTIDYYNALHAEMQAVAASLQKSMTATAKTW